ncbi:MAG: dipeptidase [Bacteroidales bacterium]
MITKSGVEAYINQNKDKMLEELFSVLRIPSISSDPSKKDEMYRVAEKMKEVLLNAGADKAEVYETVGNPVCYAEKLIDSQLPTVLVYGHMDVMPVDPLSLWDSEPFEPIIKDGRIWGRGANDDKGQSFMHIKAFEYLLKSGELNCNVKFMLEGEEEIGSPSLGRWCEEHKEMLAADVILVSDTSMIDENTATVTTGLRGLAYWEIELTGPAQDLHSGLFGGAVTNPINALCQTIASLTDQNGKLTIPGFYDDVHECSDAERQLLNKAPFDETSYKKLLDIDEVNGEAGFTTLERTGIRPSFDVCGIWGGYMGEGAKTVLPSKAYAKISTRLVPNQDYDKISKLVKEHLEAHAPRGTRIKVSPLHGGNAYVCPIDSREYEAAVQACLESFGHEPIPVRSGGSIPIISTFEKVLGIKSLLLGFGLESDAIHSPNENFALNRFYKGIETIVMFYKNYGGEK